MAVTIEIPKQGQNLKAQTRSLLGVSFLYSLAFAALLFIVGLFRGTLSNWQLYMWLSLGLFVAFTVNGIFTHSIFYKNRAWGKYTIDAMGVKILRDTKEVTYRWETFSSYSITPFTYAKYSRDPGSNEKLYPKFIRIPRYIGRYLLLLYWSQGPVKQLALPLEVPIDEKDLGQVKDWVRTKLVENTGLKAKFQKFIEDDVAKHGQ